MSVQNHPGLIFPPPSHDDRHDQHLQEVMLLPTVPVDGVLVLVVDTVYYHMMAVEIGSGCRCVCAHLCETRMPHIYYSNNNNNN